MARQAVAVEAKNEGVRMLVAYFDVGEKTRAELARAVGFDPSRLRRIVLGAEPTLREARALAEIAGVRMSAWLDPPTASPSARRLGARKRANGAAQPRSRRRAKKNEPTSEVEGHPRGNGTSSH